MARIGRARRPTEDRKTQWSPELQYFVSRFCTFSRFLWPVRKTSPSSTKKREVDSDWGGNSYFELFWLLYCSFYVSPPTYFLYSMSIDDDEKLIMHSVSISFFISPSSLFSFAVLWLWQPFTFRLCEPCDWTILVISAANIQCKW